MAFVKFLGDYFQKLAVMGPKPLEFPPYQYISQITFLTLVFGHQFQT